MKLFLLSRQEGYDVAFLGSSWG